MQHAPRDDRPVSERARREWFRLKKDYPIQWDWTLQDGGAEFYEWFMDSRSTRREQLLIQAVAKQLQDSEPVVRALEVLRTSSAPPDDPRWLALYARACELRRRRRLESLVREVPQLVFVKRHTIRPSFFAYTEGQSDAQDERHFLPGSELCLARFTGLHVTIETLVADPTGVLRDPAVSWDGCHILFAWKKSLDHDDYHLYEMEVPSGAIRQVTSELGFADYEPLYLPNNDIVFASTRCVQTVDCWWTEVSHLYACDRNGHYLRQLTFDQVHSVFPQLMYDGRVIYTRWDYNDRGQIFPQPLFQMHQDGTFQTELYGNNSWFPTTIVHARGIPGTGQVLAVLCGHHTAQAGKLAVIDPAQGRQENSGVQLVSPRRATPPERVDAYGQEGSLWQYPYPLENQQCLVAFAPLGWDCAEARADDADFGICWMNFEGDRELLFADEQLPCTQPVPLVPRTPPLPRATQVDYTARNGTYYVHDVYSGPGLAGVPRGSIEKLRVVGLKFRAAGIGNNGSEGPAGDALVSTPISVGNGAWDVKVVLGEARVYDDGSALFTVPARMPLYFQAVDRHGFVAQTMRSWSTLQPGEYGGCTGCHEHKNTAAANTSGFVTQASAAGPQPLTPFNGPPRGFSFRNEVQPILDRQCTQCHKERSEIRELAQGGLPVLARLASARQPHAGISTNTAFSLLRQETIDLSAKRRWSDAYLVLTQAARDTHDYSNGAFWGNPAGPMITWNHSQSVPQSLPPYSAGSCRSQLMALLDRGHGGVKLSAKERETIACWIDLAVPYCGDYLEANAWSEAEMRKYEHFYEKRRQMEEMERDNLRQLTGLPEVRERSSGRYMR
jgi:hypothetical protein